MVFGVLNSACLIDASLLILHNQSKGVTITFISEPANPEGESSDHGDILTTKVEK